MENTSGNRFVDGWADTIAEQAAELWISESLRASEEVEVKVQRRLELDRAIWALCAFRDAEIIEDSRDRSSDLLPASVLVSGFTQAADQWSVRLIIEEGADR